MIELGFVGSGGDELPDPPSRSSPWRRRQVRRVAAAVLAALCLASVTASDHAPAPRGLRTLWDAAFGTGDTFAAAGDTVVVLNDDATAQRLTGYRRGDGVVRWSRTLDYRAAYVFTAADPGVVLLPAGERTAPSTTDPTATEDYFTQAVAVDATTGAELWRVPGDLTAAGFDARFMGGGVLLVDHHAASADAAQVRLVGLRDGRTLWSRATPGVQWVAPGPDPRRPDRIATVDRSGRVRVLRMSDGAPIGGGTVEWQRSTATDHGYPVLEWHGTQVYVLRMSDTRVTTTAYGGQPLRRLWRVDDPTADAGYGCGPVWCLSSGTMLAGRDWDTGAERWRAPYGDFTRSIGDTMLAIHGGPGSRYRIVDAATGRTVAALGGEPLSDDFGTVVLTLTPTIRPLGLTAVGRVDLRTGESFLLGAIDGATSYGCTIEQRLLFCPSIHRRLTVTAIG
ncbi:hypothetical protein KRMM14A1259_32060 [Krasilnikovia sp. MM14-A1259]